MDKINVRQIALLYAVVLPATRFLVYPSTLAYYAGNDLLFSAAACIALEGGMLALVFAMSKRTDKTLFGLLEQGVGRPFARAIYLLFCLYFAWASFFPLLEQKIFVLHAFYENVPSLFSFIPFFAVSLYACTKGFCAVGRAADLSLPVFALCFSALLLLSLPEADFSALLPLGGAGAEGIAKGGLFGIEKYANCLYPLFFLGHFERKKGDAAKLAAGYAVGAAATLLFLGCFYGIYAQTSLSQQYALSQTAKYTTAFTSLGRIDLLFVYALSLVLSFAACLPMQLSVHCAKSAIGCKPLVPALLLNGALLAASVFFSGAYRELQQIVIERLWFLPLLFAYLLPALAALFAFAKGRKKNA